MEVCGRGLTPDVDEFLRKFTAPFPQSLYDNLIRIESERSSDRDILPWVRRDLIEKLKLFGSDYAQEKASIEGHLADERFRRIAD